MVDFANSFPDAQVFNQLGDQVELIDTNGRSTFISAVFDYEYEDEELGDRLSIKIPYIDVTDNVNATISNQQVKYNGATYAIHHRRPIDTGLIRIVLRSLKSI